MHGWEMILRGGIMMPPLLLSSILALAICIERAFYLRRKHIVRPEVLDFIKRVESADRVEEVLKSAVFGKGPFWNIVRTAVENRHEDRESIREAIEDRGRVEIQNLERGLAVLETIAGIAPLLGLLGTVLGMMKVFRVISEQGLGQTQAFSIGISEALITTVVGLFIAIPALVAYNYFDHRVNDLVLEIEQHSSRLLKRLENFRNVKRGRT